MIHITLYDMRCEPHRVDKERNLLEVAQVIGDFRDTISITDPIITFTNEKLFKYNYVFVKELHRYYFVNDVTILANGAHMVTLHEDVLYSFKNSIKAQTAYVDRNANDYDDDLIDQKIVIEQSKQYETIALSGSPFETDDLTSSSIVLESMSDGR